MTERRKTIARYGQHGRKLRVIEDHDRQLYTVIWYVRSLARQKSWPLTDEGKAAAIAWAEDFLTTRDLPPTRPPATLRELWLAYQESEFAHLRPRSQQLYAYRWKQWELFVDRSTVAEGVTVTDVARFRDAMLAAGRAINQVAEAVKVAKLVHNWGYQHGFLRENRLAHHRFKRPKGALRYEPGEFRLADLDAMLREFDPTRGTEWRPWVALMLLGHQGMRENAVRHLRWEDVRGDRILWPPRFQKTGRAFGQPLRWGGLAALETARYWRERTGYTGPWVLPGTKGGVKPYGAQGLWRALRLAERRAGITHDPYRMTHGFRRMVVGEIAAATGNPVLALQFVGDRDLSVANSYIKARFDILAHVAGVLDTETVTKPQLTPSGVIGSR